MKYKWIKIVSLCTACFVLVSCGSMINESKNQINWVEDTQQTKLVKDSKDWDTEKDLQTEDLNSTEKDSIQSEQRAIMVNGKLYLETGEISGEHTCGVMDGKISSSVEKGMPTEDNQSNFGTDYGYQYGSRENRIDVYNGDHWSVFAYNENNLEGVSMEVTENTNTSAIITTTSTSDLEVIYGDSYILECQDSKTGEWNELYTGKELAYHDIAYVVKKGGSAEWKVDWKEYYGELEPGTYRIVKKYFVNRETGDDTDYTLMAEFIVQ